MSQSSFDQLLKKYLSGECTREEEKIVLGWYEHFIGDSDVELSEEERLKIERRLWNAITTNIGEDDQPVQRIPAPVKKWPHWWRVAAAAIIIVGIGTWMVSRKIPNDGHIIARLQPAEGYQKFANETAAEKQLMLADSTIITLRSGATVYYPAAFSGKAREVYLNGSAFFKVYHNPLRHFLVHLHGRLTTEVLGTSFQILQPEALDRIEVQVVAGKVCVYRQQAGADAGDEAENRIFLTRNKKVVFNAISSQFTTGLVDNPQPLENIKTGTGPSGRHVRNGFSFEDEELDSVLSAVGRAYGLSITMANEKLGHYHFTGNIAGYDLFKKLDIICQSTQSTYEITGTEIMLKEK